jgi:hypothetical protein
VWGEWSAAVLGVPFIGWDSERRGQEASVRRWSLTLTVSAMKWGEESMRRRASVGEMETVRQCIDLTSSERGRVATGGARRGGASGGRRQLG